jgi:hypothetical protein
METMANTGTLLNDRNSYNGDFRDLLSTSKAHAREPETKPANQ